MLQRRYNDKKNLITDRSELQLSSTEEVLIYREDEWHDEIVVDLEGRKEKFEELKPLIVFVAENLCEMDYIAQKYSALCGDHEFVDGYVVAYVCLRDPDLISLTYYGTCENTQFDVVFQHSQDGLVLKSFGMVKEIDPDWDK